MGGELCSGREVCEYNGLVRGIHLTAGVRKGLLSGIMSLYHQ